MQPLSALQQVDWRVDDNTACPVIVTEAAGTAANHRLAGNSNPVGRGADGVAAMA
jgi:hypothetical protein